MQTTCCVMCNLYVCYDRGRCAGCTGVTCCVVNGIRDVTTDVLCDVQVLLVLRLKRCLLCRLCLC